MTESRLKFSIILACIIFGWSFGNFRHFHKKEKKMRKKADWADIDGGRLFYETAGEGFPLVFLSTGLEMSMWDDQFDFFSQHFKVIRFDHRGFGRSSKPDKPFYPYKDVFSLLKFLHVKKAHVMGLSMGGAVAVDFVLEYPEMVSSLILAGPSVNGVEYSDELVQKHIEIYSVAQKKGASEAVRMIFEDSFWSYNIPHKNNPGGRDKLRLLMEKALATMNWDRSLVKALDPPAIQRISEIKAPTLLIAAGKDYPDTMAVMDRLESEIDGATRKIIPGACHMMNMDKPEEFNRIVLDFLAEIHYSLKITKIKRDDDIRKSDSE